MKEVFIRINETHIKWNGPHINGSEPISNSNRDETLGKVVKFINDVSNARNEEWALRFVFFEDLVK